MDIKTMYNNQEYNAIVSAVKENKRRELSEWDFNYYVKALYKTKQYESCLEEYKAFKYKYPESSLADSTMTWALYMCKIKNYDFASNPAEKYFSYVEFALKHSVNDKYSARVRIILETIKNIYDKKVNSISVDYELLYKYLILVNPDELSEKERVVEINGKKRVLSSERESWYSKLIKTLYQLKQYEKCCKSVDEALKSIEKFHSNNYHWFSYRKAESLFAIGRLEEAELLLEEIVKKFEHWTIYDTLFKVNKELGNRDKALLYISKASTFDRGHDMRVTFYQDVASYLYDEGMEKAASLHEMFSRQIREEKGWKNKNFIDEEHLLPEIEVMENELIFRNLKSYWQSWKQAVGEYEEGKIKRMLDTGTAGFIEDRSGNNYYFMTKDISPTQSRFEIGQNVKFIPSERYDRKKDRMSPCAIDISIVT